MCKMERRKQKYKKISIGDIYLLTLCVEIEKSPYFLEILMMIAEIFQLGYIEYNGLECLFYEIFTKYFNYFT